jgi:hypothetical protein
MKWADTFAPHDFAKLGQMLDGLLDRVRYEDPERAARIETELARSDVAGLAIEGVGKGRYEVRAGDVVVGEFHVFVLRKDGATGN